VAWLLDTNIAIHLRDRDEAVVTRFAGLEGQPMLSVITVVELEGGVWTQPERARIRRRRLDQLLADLPVLPFEMEAAAAYRRIVEVTGYSRRKVLDRMIAAQALVISATVVSTNADDFRDIPGLQLLAW
jgi:tRNA(fMet)-specific endonuclease VapC